METEKQVFPPDWFAAAQSRIQAHPDIVQQHLRDYVALLRSQQPVSGGDWLEEQDFYEAMQGYRCAPREDQREVMAHFEHVKRFIRARLSAPQASGWRPIESAPKDGTRVLIYQPEAMGQKVQEASWVTPWDGATDDRCWWSTPYGPSGRGYTILPRAVTHWQPLPASPTQQGDGNG